MYVFTSESVSCGHPDKVCDQISDAILDEFLRQDPESKVACECFITNNMLVIGGEAHTTASVNIIGVAKKVLENIGYNGTNGFNPETAVFINTLHEQSPDIRRGVEKEDVEYQGAGDQGIMFGFACNQTKNKMPIEITLANETMKAYDKLRKNGKLIGVCPDAKCQFTVEYDENKKPVKTETVVFSMQHTQSISLNKTFLNETLKENFKKVIKEVEEQNPELKDFLTPSKLYINPTGSFVIGGPEGDTGLTGRKIIVDTYGGKAPHGGGAFSGKDPSKVDRSASYYARFIAKNLVAAGVGDNITVQLSYAIGIDLPTSITVYGDLNYDGKFISKMVNDIFNPTPYNIIKSLDLKNPIYEKTATYGHFGNESYPWEKLSKVEEIKRYINQKFV